MIPWGRDRLPTPVYLGFPCGSADKESACNAGDLGSIPGLGRSPGEGKGYPLQYSVLENSTDRGAEHNWVTTVELVVIILIQFSSVPRRVWLFVTPWVAARQASLSITNSPSLPKLIESVMPSSHLILCHPLLLLPPIPPSIRVFSNESTLRMRWPKY